MVIKKRKRKNKKEVQEENFKLKTEKLKFGSRANDSIRFRLT